MPGITFANLTTGEAKQLAVVPNELTEGVTAEYVKHSVLGLSHKRHHYTGTTNHAIPNLQFKYVSETIAQRDRMDDERRFLLSLMYATEASDGVLRGGPPRVLFLWPSLISFTTIVENAQFTHTKFNRLGAPVVTDVTISIEEIRDVRLTSAEVRERGTIR